MAFALRSKRATGRDRAGSPGGSWPLCSGAPFASWCAGKKTKIGFETRLTHRLCGYIPPRLPVDNDSEVMPLEAEALMSLHEVAE